MPLVCFVTGAIFLLLVTNCSGVVSDSIEPVRFWFRSCESSFSSFPTTWIYDNDISIRIKLAAALRRLRQKGSSTSPSQRRLILLHSALCHYSLLGCFKQVLSLVSTHIFRASLDFKQQLFTPAGEAQTKETSENTTGQRQGGFFMLVRFTLGHNFWLCHSLLFDKASCVISFFAR